MTNLILLMLLGRVATAASVSVVPVSLEQQLEAPRWMYDSKAKIKGGALVRAMVEAKRSLSEGKSSNCLAALSQVQKLGKSLGPWIALNRVRCAQLQLGSDKSSLADLAQAIKQVDLQPRWLLFGPAARDLRVAYVSGLLALVEGQTKTDRRAAWRSIDQLQVIKSWLTPDERANVYKWAGELAFVEQNLSIAQDFLSRSLGERENSEIRTRVESIRASLLGKRKESESSSSVSAGKVEDLGMSEGERELVERMDRSQKSQDYVAAIEDGIELIQKYPGSARALEATDRVLDIYLSISSRSDEKFQHIRETIVKEMQKADGARLARWANNAYARGNYVDGLNLAETAYQKLAGQPESTKVLLVSAESAVAAGEYSEAQGKFELLLKQHGGTPEAVEATFRLGLLEFRRRRYSQAAAQFERLLVLKGASDYEYRAMYWLWRSRQKIDDKKASSFAQNLIDKYPLTYYGLRAMAEENRGILQFSSDAPSIKAELHLLESERLGWERIGVLLKAGWFDEAQSEMQALPEPQDDVERIVRAKYWAAVFRYDFAMKDLAQVLEKERKYLKVPIIKMIFPDEYSELISSETKGGRISDLWVKSLIRQESSFLPDAKSPSNALGVMQLLPSTAVEIARDLKIKNFSEERLSKPDVNIKIGVNYLNRLQKSFSGNIPLALAAYNAGPGRIKKWLESRKDLSRVAELRSSSPEVEVWIDELPWDETSFYVKSILRNYLIYQLLDGSKLAVSEPIWVDVKSKAR